MSGLSYADEVTLCELVGQSPCLYDPNDPGYKDTTIRENTWSKIAQCIGKRADICKRRWKNIRDTYNRQKKTTMFVKASRWSLMEKLTYLEATFNERHLIPNLIQPSLVQEEMTVSGDDFPSTSEETEQENDNSTDFPIKVELINEGYQDSPEVHHHERRKRKLLEESLTDIGVTFKRVHDERDQDYGIEDTCMQAGEDATDVFFRSMALSVKKLPPSLIAEAKRQVCNIVTGLELRALQMDSSQTSSVGSLFA